ncbi:hypothetical protein SAMN05216251_1432 [Actinacidiphila alni]|uniref:Uncharacterized protein n=1 Tax=Actinacidiphila alni TaxID=380248 RepID=A0A1I2MT66_9ACTN|nr:hypothetical protein [Actinacidiphila alni]SFF94613.1 hypothetical protein SAMN05216251_1432 [Actinacidiphila alni]
MRLLRRRRAFDTSAIANRASTPHRAVSAGHVLSTTDTTARAPAANATLSPPAVRGPVAVLDTAVHDMVSTIRV